MASMGAIGRLGGWSRLDESRGGIRGGIGGGTEGRGARGGVRVLNARSGTNTVCGRNQGNAKQRRER